VVAAATGSDRLFTRAACAAFRGKQFAGAIVGPPAIWDVPFDQALRIRRPFK